MYLFNTLLYHIRIYFNTLYYNCMILYYIICTLVLMWSFLALLVSAVLESCRCKLHLEGRTGKDMEWVVGHSATSFWEGRLGGRGVCS